MSRRPVPVVALLMIAAAACGGATSTTTRGAATTAAPTPTTIAPTTLAPAATTTQAPATTVAVERTELCDSYLEFRGAQDAETVGGSLDTLRARLDFGGHLTDDVAAAINAFQSGDFGDRGIGEWIVVIRDVVLPLCDAEYHIGVVGAADDVAAADFFAALVSGDRAAAALLAQAEVIAQFEPWASYGAGSTMEMEDSGFTAQLDGGPAIRCEIEDGVVERCVRI